MFHKKTFGFHLLCLYTIVQMYYNTFSVCPKVQVIRKILFLEHSLPYIAHQASHVSIGIIDI